MRIAFALTPRWLQLSTQRQRLSISFGDPPRRGEANYAQFAGSESMLYTLRWNPEMSSITAESSHSANKPATRLSIVLAFASVYFFWGSTYTAIRIGAAEMPALLLAGTRFLIAGTILLAWCRWRGLRLVFPARTMLLLGFMGLLLLGGGNVGLVYAEQTLPSGLSSLILAVIPLYVALIEMFLPGGEPMPRRGWLGMAIGFAGLAALLWPSLRTGFAGDRSRLLAITALLAGALSWTVGSIFSRRTKLPVNSFVAASWQMIAAGVFNTALGSVLGQWPQFHLNRAAIGSLAWLVTGGSLLGYTGFIYLIEHVPVAKVTSYSYVNPVVAVLLGIFILHERPEAAEFIGMAAVVFAVFLLTTAQVGAKARET
jgi:drug/metabolite transporter (DMT)-like permease